MKFSSQLIAIIIDEVHCLKLWSSFRREYQDLGWPRSVHPDRVHFALVSAALPRPVLMPVMSHLGITSSELYAVRLSNDRDNIALVVRKKLSMAIFGSWTNGTPRASGGKPLVVAYLRHSIMLVLPLPLHPTITVAGEKNSMTEIPLSSDERIPRTASLFSVPSFCQANTVEVIVRSRRRRLVSSDHHNLCHES